MPNNEGLLSVKEAADYCREAGTPISTQSIYKALTEGRLRAARRDPWLIREGDLLEWLGTRRA